MRSYLLSDGHVAAVKLLDGVPDDDAVRQATAIFIGRMGKYRPSRDGPIGFRRPDERRALVPS
jgi:hypothetical protein